MHTPLHDYIFLSGNRFHPASIVTFEREGLIEKVVGKRQQFLVFSTNDMALYMGPAVEDKRLGTSR